MSDIRKKLSEKIKTWREETKDIIERGGDKELSNVTIGQAYGGMRGVRALICDTSRVPREEGLIKPLKKYFSCCLPVTYRITMSFPIFQMKLKREKKSPVMSGMY